MLYIPFSIGYLLKDWKGTINAIIKKKRKGNLVKDLRMISLIEANFNFNNKVMARLIMNCAEANKLLPDKQ